MTDSRHVPVLKAETLDILEPGPGKKILDGTFGFGGHTAAFLAAGAEVLALDLDGTAHAACLDLAAAQSRLICRRTSFRKLDRAVAEAGWDRLDGVLLDLGVSSLQLDDPGKGFTYRAGGPLDLRFDQRSGNSAADLVRNLSETEIADLIWKYGEERSSRRLARAIVRARAESPLTTTDELARVLTAAVPRGQKAEPVLSRVFQSLRIAVNEELTALEETLAKLPDLLAPGGRFVVLAYHSLEDRLVKRFIDRQQRDCLCPPEVLDCRCGHTRTLERLTRGAVKASTSEIGENPRARSVRLRAAERL